jgi:hypothetical protein
VTAVPASDKLVALLHRLLRRGNLYYVNRGNAVDIIAVSRISATGWSVQRTISAGTLRTLTTSSRFRTLTGYVPEYDPARRSALYRTGGSLLPPD